MHRAPVGYSDRRRWTRVVGYVLMAVAGSTAIAWPSPSVRAAAGAASYLTIAWAVMLVVGGIASAVGAALDRWLGEYTGLWPLIVTFTIYALTIAANGHLYGIAGAALLASIAFLLLSRWRDVAALRQYSRRNGHNGR